MSWHLKTLEGPGVTPAIIKNLNRKNNYVWTGLCVRASPGDSAHARALLSPLCFYSFALFKLLKGIQKDPDRLCPTDSSTFWIQLILTSRTFSLLNLFCVAVDLTNSYFNCQKILQHIDQNPMQKEYLAGGFRLFLTPAVLFIYLYLSDLLL